MLTIYLSDLLKKKMTMTNSGKRVAFVTGIMLLLFHLMAVVSALVTHDATLITVLLIADVPWVVYKVAQGIAERLWP